MTQYSSAHPASSASVICDLRSDTVTAPDAAMRAVMANAEVGDDVYQAFVSMGPQAGAAFIQGREPNKWMADIYQLARLQLEKAGVNHIYGGELCTYADSTRFYSYRRDGIESGRMASLIWRGKT